MLTCLPRTKITTQKQKQPVPYEKAVSTIFAKTLAGLADGKLPSLESSTAVTIQLVNLWYPVPFANAPHHAFGYLIPQAVGFDQNPECVLGVIFDSDREFSVPTRSSPEVINRGADTIHGTKLTVMLGGHYWDGLPESFLPDAAAAAEMAKKAVERHLNLDPALSAQAVVSTKLCRECIPQHLVGHGKRMIYADRELEWAFKGRLAVAGQSYTNPGVLGAVRAARDVAVQIGGAWRVDTTDKERWQLLLQQHEEQLQQLQQLQRGPHLPLPQPLADCESDALLSVGDTGLARFGKARFMSLHKLALPLRFGGPDYVHEDGRLKIVGSWLPDREDEQGRGDGQKKE